MRLPWLFIAWEGYLKNQKPGMSPAGFIFTIRTFIKTVFR